MIPLEFAGLRLAFDGRRAVVPTGKRGEFYLDPLELGEGSTPADAGECADLLTEASASEPITELQGHASFTGEEYAFHLDLLHSDDLIVDLGTIVVNRPPAPDDRQGEAER